MKHFSKLIVLLLLLVAAVFTVTSCDKTTVSEISVSESGMPQLVYVLGNDLDLSNGMLTVKEKDATREIALNSEGITVSGYDKSVLGQQTVTISYEGQTTQITVTVVERMQVVDYIADYLVGDEIDLSKGRLKITRDDGSSYTVLLNHSSVTVTGFTSESTGSVQLSVQYTGGEKPYETGFSVNVHIADDIKLQRPNKITYNSHDEGIDLSGGYLTLKGNNGTLEKDIPLSDIMISGFDLNAVTEENSPLTQKVTVSYLGKEFSFDVKITYTDISLFKKNVSLVKDLVFTEESAPEISKELGEKALEMMELYLDMSKAEQALIPTEDILQMARTAMVYGWDVWAEEILKYSDVFAIEYGELVLYCDSYDAVKATILGLQDTSTPLYTVGPILMGMMEVFGEETTAEGYTFADYPLMGEETFAGLSVVFEYMLNMYDKFALIPDDWAEQGVMKYAYEIVEAYNYIAAYAGSVDSSLTQIYYYVSMWRTNDDAFDILYNYFYTINDVETLKGLSTIRLPRQLEELYLYVATAMEQMSSLQQYGVFDTSEFFYNYYLATELAEELRNSTDAETLFYFQNVPVNGMFGFDYETLYYFDTILEYIRSTDGGYYTFAGGMLGVDAYHALMDQYMDIVIKMFDDPSYEGSEEYGAAVRAMFMSFVNLTPTQQYYFLNSLSPFYSMGIPPFSFDDSEDMSYLTCIFAQLINDYYKGLFTEEASVDAYRDLVLVIELYAQRFTYDGDWVAVFIEGIDGVKAAFDAMTGADKANFELYLGDVLDKYLSISNRYRTPAPVELGEWESVFAELKEAMLNLELANYLLSNEIYAYSFYFSAYERAESLCNYIIANAPKEILDAYYYDELYDLNEDLNGGGTGEDGSDFGGDSGDTEEMVPYTYDFQLYLYRTLYISYQLSFMDSINIYDIYADSDLKEFVNLTYDVLWNYLYSDEDPATKDFDRAKVVAAMTAFSKLSVDEQIIFIMMEGDYGYYYMGLDACITESFTEKAGAVIYKLLELEQYRMTYEYTLSAENLASMEKALGELKALYAGLSGADKLDFADMEEAYAQYVSVCEALIAQANTPAA